jgi:hypothetical protein
MNSPTNKDHYVDNMAYVGIEYECAVVEEREREEELDRISYKG